MIDEFLVRLNKLYPGGAYMTIAPYDADKVKQRMVNAGKDASVYDSSYDDKKPEGKGSKWSTSPLTYAEAVEAAEKGYRIGWVVPKGYCVIDVDNKDNPQSSIKVEEILKKLGIKYNFNYTSRGIHILFKNSDANIKSVIKWVCGLNIVVDARANGTGYIVLPCNDPHRKWGRLEDIIDEVPAFLRPALQIKTDSFIGLVNGDGRNDALWKWRLKLMQSHKFEDTDIEQCIKLINDYLLAEPMTNQELYSTVLRQIDKDKYSTKSNPRDRDNPYNEMAKEFLNRCDIVSYYNNFYRFNGIYYKEISEVELEKMIHDEISESIGRAGRKEILEYLKLKTQIGIDDFNRDWHKIACQNGIINLVTGELEPPNKNEVNTIAIPHSYNADPDYSPRIDQFMKELTGGDVIKMQFLYQVAGYCLLKRNFFQKFVIFKGEGGTGKSTYMNLINKLVGEVNCSHIGLADFDKDYYIASTMNKLVNIDDDVVDGKVLENTGRFKSMISGDIIAARQIYEKVVAFIPFATCVFSCNRLPKIMDRTSGLYRRLLLIELNNKVINPDPLFVNKVTPMDMEYFLFKAVEGIKLALEENRFRITTSDAELIKLFKRRQSPLNEWLYINDIRIGDLHGHKVMPLFQQFVEWATNNGYKGGMTSFTFKDDMCHLYDMELKFMKLEESSAPVQVFYKEGQFDPDYKPF